MGDFPVSLCAKFKDSYSWFNVNEKLPVIISKVIEDLNSDKDAIALKYGNESLREVKEIINRLNNLKVELRNDKQLTPLTVEEDDLQLWTNSFCELREKMVSPTWRSATMLYVGSYAYRRIYEAFQHSRKLRNYDYFLKLKESSLILSLDAVTVSSHFLKNVLNDLDTEEKVRIHLAEWMKLSLWGNKCDLALTAGTENAQKSNPITMLTSLQKNILRDDSKLVVDYIFKTKLAKHNGVQIDIVLDNAGYELFCDLCLAHYLCASKVATQIRFFVKRIPWYVSDVTEDDFTSAINALRLMSQQNNEPVISELTDTWEQYLRDGTWVIETDLFWTTPYPFRDIKKHDTDLYQKLAEADLIIFKGDLNYRKLTGDYYWNYATHFDTALAGFNPAPLCALRALKTECVVGLTPGRGEKIHKVNKHWMVEGEYAVVQFTKTVL